MLPTLENYTKIKSKFLKYMERYKEKYTDIEKEYIYKNFNRFLYDNAGPDILMQIYSELDITHIDGDFYDEHLNKVKSIFGLDKNILEVASGYMPSFANKIAKYQQKIGKGTITLYEPLLIIDKPKYPNMKLHREEFKESTPIKDYDLLIGILTCEATTPLLEAALDNDKDFYVAMCGCAHENIFGQLMPPSIYHDITINMVENRLRKKGQELVVEHLPEEFEITYPILHNRRK